jgi:hypothetical protein
MNKEYKIVITEDEYGMEIQIGEYRFTLLTLMAYIDSHNKHSARAQDLCLRHGLGRLGESTIEACLAELERLKYAESKMFNGI